MDNNGMSVDLRKIKRDLPPVQVPPLGVPAKAAPPPPPPQAPKIAMKEPERLRPTAENPQLGVGNRTRSIRIWKWSIPLKVPSWKVLAAGAGAIVLLYGAHYLYTHFWTKSPFGATGSAAATTTTPTPPAAPDIGAMSETEIVNLVGKLMLLPDGETPTLAKVSDLSALASQPFFKNAAVGDVVLMYGKSRKAVLYDPAANKIIEVAPITDDNATIAATSTTKK